MNYQFCTEDELNEVYSWVDEVPLSRQKRNISRDFSDGVLMAEIINHFLPRLVELHNYSPANCFDKKMYNWATLNRKVFKRLGFVISKEEMTDIANSNPGVVEVLLKMTRQKIIQFQEKEAAYQFRKETKKYQNYSTQRSQMQSSQRSNKSAPIGSIRQQDQDQFSDDDSNHFTQDESDNQQIIRQQEQQVIKLQKENQVLKEKVLKQEQLIRLKDIKIDTFINKLNAAGL